MNKVREHSVEVSHVAAVKALGGRSYKWVSPSLRGVPDRITLFPVPPAHQAIVAQYVKFCEIKRPGLQMKPHQKRRAEELRALGFEVLTINELE